MEKLKQRVELLKQYLNDIIHVIKSYRPNGEVQSLKDISKVANELANLIMEQKSSVKYLDNIEDSEYYIAMQVPVSCNDTSKKTTFYLKANSRTTISSNGINIYNSINKKISVTNHYPTDVEENDENWKPFNIIIRSNSNFSEFYIKNQNIISVIANLEGIEDTKFEEMFLGNKKLRTVKLVNCQTYTFARMFKGCENLVSVDVKTAVVNDMSSMFENCRSLQKVEIDFTGCGNATDMFKGCESLEEIKVLNESRMPMKNLDLSYCINMSSAKVIEFLNSLPKSTFGTTITVPVELSTAQINSFKNKGYTIVCDTSKKVTASALDDDDDDDIEII